MRSVRLSISDAFSSLRRSAGRVIGEPVEIREGSGNVEANIEHQIWRETRARFVEAVRTVALESEYSSKQMFTL